MAENEVRSLKLEVSRLVTHSKFQLPDSNFAAVSQIAAFRVHYQLSIINYQLPSPFQLYRQLPVITAYYR